MEPFSLFSPDMKDYIKALIKEECPPSAYEFVSGLERKFGKQDWQTLKSVLFKLAGDREFSDFQQKYLLSMLNDEGFIPALLKEKLSDREISSGVDALIQASSHYRTSAVFREMVEFIGKFRKYSPYNNMLVKIQNPSCAFYATEKVWRDRFSRGVMEDARPMLILAPRHPVLLVYDLDSTEGPALPKKLEEFATFEGPYEEIWLENLIKNAYLHKIHVDFKKLSTVHAGFAESAPRQAEERKYRIVVDSNLSPQSQFGVLCHEMAHILLGHLGNTSDEWWPFRRDLGLCTVEVEAEATAYIVTRRLGLKGSSVAYISSYVKEDSNIPAGVSLDMIARVASRIEKFAKRVYPAPRSKSERNK